MKKIVIALSLYLIAGASLTVASDTEKRSQLEQEIRQLNDDIILIDIELGKKVTHGRDSSGSTYINFDISSQATMDLLGERSKKSSTLENKERELEALTIAQ